MKAQRIQTKGADGFFGLSMLEASPYFNIFRGAIVQIPVMTLKCFILGYTDGGPGVAINLQASDGSISAQAQVPITVAYSSTDATIQGAIETTITNYCVNFFGIQAPDVYDWCFATLVNIPTAPSSYQTIVSQTGTAAPAVSGSLVPTSTYASGTTFTWARSSTGVYTLTASTAVFNTAGKTSVFISPLNNLNGAVTAVITSSTVITITTAVQSLAVLGLLGFTATPTDALLTKAMVYVQTYA